MVRKIVNVIKEMFNVEKADPIEVKWKEEIEEVGSPESENGEIEKVQEDMYKDSAGDDRQGNNEQRKGIIELNEQTESLPKRLRKVSIKRSTDFLWTDLCKK
jgi:hypothetical protein